MPGPRRNGEGPASHRQPLCCRRGNQPLYVRHVFLFVFFFMSLMWAREGGMFPLLSSPSVAAPRYSAPHPRNPSSSSHRSIHICFYSFLPPTTPLSPLPFLPFFVSLCFYPWRSFVKAPCLDGPYLCCWVVPLTWTPHPPFFNFSFMRIWHKVAFFVFFS